MINHPQGAEQHEIKKHLGCHGILISHQMRAKCSEQLNLCLFFFIKKHLPLEPQRRSEADDLCAAEESDKNPVRADDEVSRRESERSAGFVLGPRQPPAVLVH